VTSTCGAPTLGQPGYYITWLELLLGEAEVEYLIMLTLTRPDNRRDFARKRECHHPARARLCWNSGGALPSTAHLHG